MTLPEIVREEENPLDDAHRFLRHPDGGRFKARPWSSDLSAAEELAYEGTRKDYVKVIPR